MSVQPSKYFCVILVVEVSENIFIILSFALQCVFRRQKMHSEAVTQNHISMFDFFKISDVNNIPSHAECEVRPDRLLTWCQRQTNGYRGVDITNLTSSWRSGLALCALIHKQRPELMWECTHGIMTDSYSRTLTLLSTQILHANSFILARDWRDLVLTLKHGYEMRHTVSCSHAKVQIWHTIVSHFGTIKICP